MEHRIVFLDRGTVAPQITIRRPAFPHAWEEHDRTKPDEVVERLSDATIAIVNKVKINKDHLDQLPNLRLIAAAATGTDNYDLAACKEKSITVSNIRGYAVSAVPEHTFALMLSLMRAVGAYRDDVAAGEWKKADQFCFFNHPINDLNGKRLGIFGGGSIGRSVARIADAFGMETVFAARKGQTDFDDAYRSFDEVLETADVITFHMPLTPETRAMIGPDEFAAMKRKPLIVNTARGGIIKNADLADALRKNLIRGAAVDVMDTEPPADDDPLMALLPTHKNLIVTPHVAWASDEAMQILCDQLIDNIENYVNGAPTNVVV